MRLTIVNCSIHKKGNTDLALKAFGSGFAKVPCNRVKYLYIKDMDCSDSMDQVMESSDIILIGFPLTINFLPGDVLGFIHSLFLSKLKTNMAFLVTSGFPESSHSQYVEAYLKGQTTKSNNNYLGTVIRGGFTGVNWLAPNPLSRIATSLLLKKIKSGGKFLGKHYSFSDRILKKISWPYTLPKAILFLLSVIGINHRHFNNNIMREKALPLMNDTPYL